MHAHALVFGSPNADEVNSFPICVQGADGSVFAIALLDMFLYPKVTTYFGLMLRVPVMGVRTLYILVIMSETLLNQLRNSHSLIFRESYS